MTLFQRSEAGPRRAERGDELDLHITSTPLSLGIIQGFTTAVTNVTGMLRVDVRLTGSGEDPHVEGIVDIQGGGFAVPLTGVSYTGLSTSIALAPDGITIPEPADRGRGRGEADDQRLARRARAAGGRGGRHHQLAQFRADRQRAGGRRGRDRASRSPASCGGRRSSGSVKLQAARLEVDKILALFYDPYSVSAMPDVAAPPSARAETSAGAEDATRQALWPSAGRSRPWRRPPAAPAARSRHGRRAAGTGRRVRAGAS